MNIFTSYSRKDQEWVWEFCKQLKEHCRHDVWLDQQTTAAQDWWDTILSSLEACDAFIYILTPNSIDSIYCQVEMKYALALGKIILPIILEPCSYPSELKTKNIQYFETSQKIPWHQILLTVEVALRVAKEDEVNKSGIRPKNSPPKRPKQPKPTKEAQAFEAFRMAEEAFSNKNISLAKNHFKDVIRISPESRHGIASKARLDEIETESEREKCYQEILQMWESSPKGAFALWKEYLKDEKNLIDGILYDPQNMANRIEESEFTPSRGIPIEKLIERPDVLPEPIPEPLNMQEINLLTRRILDDTLFEWCEIPAGNFLMGTDRTRDRYAEFNEPEICETYLPTYAIAKYPVTYAQFKTFTKDADGINSDRWWEGLAVQYKTMAEQKWKYPNHPRENVNWYQAIAFCRWLSWKLSQELSKNEIKLRDYDPKNAETWLVRLPTEAEWEKAARGINGRIYPWGDKPETRRGNILNPQKKTTPVNQFENGKSPYHVYDMSGNTWEWCLDNWTNTYKEQKAHLIKLGNSEGRVLRGGSWEERISNTRIMSRSLHYPISHSDQTGFRALLRPFA